MRVISTVENDIKVFFMWNRKMYNKGQETEILSLLRRRCLSIFVFAYLPKSRNIDDIINTRQHILKTVNKSILIVQTKYKIDIIKLYSTE